MFVELQDCVEALCQVAGVRKRMGSWLEISHLAGDHREQAFVQVVVVQEPSCCGISCLLFSKQFEKCGAARI